MIGVLLNAVKISRNLSILARNYTLIYPMKSRACRGIVSKLLTSFEHQQSPYIPMHFSTATPRMGLKKVEFYYDVASPYSWLAFEVMHRYQSLWELDIELKPIFVHGIFKATQNTSPMLSVEQKRNYLFKDIVRSAEDCKVDLKMMKNPRELFEKGSLAPMRCLTAMQEVCEYSDMIAVSRGFWIHRWSKDEDFTDEKQIEEILFEYMEDTCNANNALCRMEATETKEQLIIDTQHAVDIGVFGVPAFYFPEDGELFFGADRFSHIANYLGKEFTGPVPK